MREREREKEQGRRPKRRKRRGRRHASKEKIGNEPRGTHAKIPRKPEAPQPQTKTKH